jgi:hypothetical protein
MEERNKQLQEISDIVNKYSPDRLKRWIYW